MVLIIEFAVLLIALAILAKASESVISSSVTLSSLTKLSELAIGFVILSVLTSLPELSVTLFSATADSMGIAVGNIFGSNIANLGLIIGLAALVGRIKVKRRELKKLSTILFLTSLIPITLLMLIEVSFFIGVILLSVFVLFTAYSIKKNIVVKGKLEEEPKEKAELSKYIVNNFIILLIGIAVVLVSSKVVVDSASNIVLEMGIAQTLIGATIIAVGTSIPELSIMLVAIRRKRVTLALGNAIGSNLTNISLILGALLVFSPISINISLFSTLVFFSVITSISTWYFIDKGRLNRLEGMALLLVYLLFLITIFGVELAIL